MIDIREEINKMCEDYSNIKIWNKDPLIIAILGSWSSNVELNFKDQTFRICSCDGSISKKYKITEFYNLKWKPLPLWKISIMNKGEYLLGGDKIGTYGKDFEGKVKPIIIKLQENNLINKIIEGIKLEEKQQELDELDKLEEARLKEERRLTHLNRTKSNILAELDKDGNGELDVVEVNSDFDTLVKKHQSKITEVDRSYILNFVKISNYQKTKRKNLQSIFNSIGKTKNQQELNNQVSLLKDQIHSYELILFHSLNMVTSLIEDDMFTFYEIYESFDKLEMFNSNHENEVSKRLINIEGGINDLMNSIRQMENNIIGELGYLSYVTQESYSELSHNVNKQLASIDSSIKANNLLTGINAYQTYKLRQGK